jgi:hypothetical protein
VLRQARDGFELKSQFDAFEQEGDILPVNISRATSSSATDFTRLRVRAFR